MTDATEFSQDPYEDGTVPADADLSGANGEAGVDDAAGESGSAASDSYNPQPGIDPVTEDEKDRAERHY